MGQKAVLAFDIGGTKILAGVVNSSGKVLIEKKIRVDLTGGKTAFVRQIAQLGRDLIQRSPHPIKKVGIASAGPLDPTSGVLLDPTNLVTSGKGWGKTPLTAPLKKALRMPVFLENDAAAAILAEHWKGAARKTNNAIILTLGTGVGTGMICNGQLVRSGRNLHPEASHISLNATDKTAPCGCGNFGCVEAYLSGNHFAERFRRKTKSKKTAPEIFQLAQTKNRAALKMFAEYAEWMALAIHSYVVLYAPEKVIFTGSFARTFSLWKKPTEQRLKQLLKRRRAGVDLLPRLELSKLDNRAGLLGGAWVAFNR